MKFTSLIFFFAFIFILTSCHGKEVLQTREKSLSEGFSLLDQQKYDEAITYFSKLAHTDPHPLVKLAWASAYAARAGVKIEQIYSFVVVRDLRASETRWQSTQEKDFYQDTFVLMQALQSYEGQWRKIQVVSGQSIQDLAVALEILADVKAPGPSLYRATLRVVVLKSYVSEGLAGWKKVSAQKICDEDLLPYYTWGLRVLQELVKLSQDLEYAYPKKQQHYEQVRRNLELFLKNVEGPTGPRGLVCP